MNVDQGINLIKQLAKKKHTFISNFLEIIYDEELIKLFIARLQVPCYQKFTKYHFWDFLTELSKKHFSKDLHKI
jgi:hypothetical protein